MPTHRTTTHNSYDGYESDVPAKNQPFKSARRAQRKSSSRAIRVRGQARSEPDVSKLARAIIAIAYDQAQREAAAEAESRSEVKDD